MGGVDPGELDAVTLDAYGTLVELDSHIGRLREALAAAGVDASEVEVERAFDAEVRLYAERKCAARDGASLAALRQACARVFTDALGVELDFTDGLTEAIRFRAIDGVPEALAAFRARGLALAVVSNWDCSLPGHLERAGISVDVVVTCADTGVAKPAPQMFEAALERLGVAAGRTLHIGDGAADERGAAAAGVRFAPAPVAEVAAAWR